MQKGPPPFPWETLTDKPENGGKITWFKLYIVRSWELTAYNFQSTTRDEWHYVKNAFVDSLLLQKSEYSYTKSLEHLQAGVHSEERWPNIEVRVNLQTRLFWALDRTFPNQSEA